MSAPWLSAFADDPAVPARDAVLDADAVGARLPAVLGVNGALRGCSLVRAKYRLGESVRATYRITLGERSHLIAARSFAPDESGAQFERALERAVPVADLPPVAHEPDLGVVWWVFPNDRRMRDLALLTSPTPTLPAADWAGWSHGEVVQLAQERSATARAYDDDGRTVGYAKAYTPQDGESMATVAARLDAIAGAVDECGGAARAPRALAASEEHRIVLQEPMSGRRWADVDRASLPLLLRGIGTALSAIHGTDPAAFGTAGLGRFARLTPERVQRCAELVGRARPDVAAQAARVAERLATTAADDPGEERVLHGDVHPGNALLDGDRVAIIDADQAGLGPAAVDVASLIARIRFGVLSGDWDRATAAELIAAFVAAYRTSHELPDPRVVGSFVGAALLAERALRAVNRVHVTGLACLAETLTLAELAQDEEPW